MSEPTSPDSGQPERLHPFFLLAGVGGSLRQLAGGYALLGYLVVSGRFGTAISVAAGLVAVTLIGAFIYWRRFVFRVGDNEIRIDSGIFSRTHRSIPFDRIQDVDISQGPLARLFGIAAARFETGGASGGEADEGTLRAIPLARAEEIRELIRGRRLGAVVEESSSSGPEQRPVFAMDLRRVLLAGLFNFSLALLAGLFGLTQTMGDVLGFDPLNDGFWRRLLAENSAVTDFILAHRAAAIGAGLLVLIVAGALTGLVRTFVREFGFRLDRMETSLRRRRGLLTRTDVSLPLRRVQAAIVGTGPVREMFGWRELKLQNLAQDEGSGDHAVAPLATQDEVGTILGELGWAELPEQANWKRVSTAYIWTFAIAISPLLLLFGAQIGILLHAPSWVEGSTREVLRREFMPLLITLSLVGAALLIAIGARALAWRRTAFALDGERLLVRTGWWRRRLRILPLDKIQSIDVVDTIVRRWFGVSDIVLGVAGGRGFSAHNIPTLPAEEARKLRNQLLISSR